MRRVLAVLTALVLAAFGAVVLISYVRGADARAEAGAVLVPVLVVDSDVPAGTPAEQVADSVSTVRVPERLVATGSLTDLADVAGLTTTVDLLAGDQVMAARFADPSVQAADGAVARAPGTQEVSLTLEPQRAVGGAVTAGDLVAVYTSAADPATATAVTGLAVDDVLVTRVDGGSDGVAALAGATVTVTLALTPDQASVVISGMQQGGVWLSLQESAGSADTSLTSTTTTGENQ